jgi:hypothetical protein
MMRKERKTFSILPLLRYFFGSFLWSILEKERDSYINSHIFNFPSPARTKEILYSSLKVFPPKANDKVSPAFPQSASAAVAAHMKAQ